MFLFLSAALKSLPERIRDRLPSVRMPTFFALHKEKITACKNAIYYCTIPKLYQTNHCMNFKSIIPLLFLSLVINLFSGCGVKPHKSSSRPVKHTLWNSLLSSYVDDDGWVNYKGFIRDSSKLNKYLQLLESHHPNDKWTINEQKAYWINAYNAYTVKLITMHYPTPSIKDIKKGIPFINTVWDIKFIHIEGATYDLNNIEHSILRPKFKDPRVHFAVNCASYSCPALRNEAYTANKLDQQLDDATMKFLTDQTKNIITEKEVKLSKIFSWYRSDFKINGGNIIDFLNKNQSIKIDKNATIEYLDYNWTLNEHMNAN